jgi:hypothetical protein
MTVWRIYYGDDTTYDDDDGAPWDAPALGVQAIAVPDAAVGRLIWSRYDYYWWDPDEDRWIGGDLFGCWDYLTRPGPRKVIFGRTIPWANHSAIMARAVQDPDLPLKSAWDEREHRGAP